MVQLVDIERRFANQKEVLEPLMNDFGAAITQLTAIREIVFEARLSKRYGSTSSLVVTEEMERSIKGEISPVQGMTADAMKQKMLDLQERLNGDMETAARKRDEARVKIIKGSVKVVFATQRMLAGEVFGGLIDIIGELPDIKKEWSAAIKDLKVDGVEFAEFADRAWTQHASFKASKLLNEVHKMGWREAESAFLHHKAVNSDEWKKDEAALPYDPVRYRMATRMENAAERSLRKLNTDMESLPTGLRAAIANGFAQRGSELFKQGYASDRLTSAVQIAAHRRPVGGEYSISNLLVEDAVVLGREAISKSVTRAQDFINTSYLERNIDQEMDRYMKSRVKQMQSGEPITVLFDIEKFRESVLQVVEPTVVRVGVKAGEKKNFNLSDLDDELDLCSRILLQASISDAASDDPGYRAACHSELEAVAGLRQRNGKEPSGRMAQITATREASAGTFSQLDGELKSELSKMNVLNAFGARIGAKAARTSVTPDSPGPLDPVNERKLT